MPGNTSSIYYYNNAGASWSIPEKSTYTVLTGNSVPIGNTKGDLAIPDADIQDYDSHITEDYRGFGPIGNFICSGSRNRYGTDMLQSDDSIGSSLADNNVNEALSKTYAKSITNNESYRATSNETFSLPIKQPFLIERAVIEIPFAFGDGWFKDKTRCFPPFHSTSPLWIAFDFGGPGLTVALFNQFEFGQKESRRDLVMTGTLTHQFDNISELSWTSDFPVSTEYNLIPVGFKAYGATAGAVVSPALTSGGQHYFTGSVAIKSEAQASNGIIAQLIAPRLSSDAIYDLLNKKELLLVDDEDYPNLEKQQKFRIQSINNFGRGGTGFDPSGRSIFGKELVTSKKVINGRIANPFYISGANGELNANNRTEILNSLGLQNFDLILGSETETFAYAAINLEETLPSPYLVLPGDKLTLAVAKTRPTLYANTTFAAANSSPWTYSSGNIVHDVQLITGSINITFYGSLIKGEVEHHDPLNQEVGSAAIHEIVAGGEPVLDQFECSYKESYVSGTYDDFIAGNMISVVNLAGRNIFVTGTLLGFNSNLKIISTGTRGKLFSRNNARTETVVPGTTAFDYSNSLSYSLQPFFERAGNVRVSQHTDNSERFYDSVMPSISECFEADGKSIVELSDALWAFFADPQKVNVSRTGFVMFGFDGGTTSPVAQTSPYIIQAWPWTYPFEPRYSNVRREINFSKSFLAKYRVTTDFLTYVQIEPTPLVGFFFGPYKPSDTKQPGPGSFEFNFVADASIKSRNSFGYYTTSSAGLNDTLKGLFGFGDENKQYIDFGATGRWGVNNFAEYRNSAKENTYFDTKYRFGVIIRGWKYGIYSGLPAYSKAYFRQGKFGQFRDMLEQRPYTNFYDERKNSTSPCVSVKFIDPNTNKITPPERTWSQNLSSEATSSLPYFDGVARNRNPIDLSIVNNSTVTL
jgi:hypothetical protein